jgi:hypothetical protein
MESIILVNSLSKEEMVMEELFRFKALHKAMGGIETDVFVFDNKIELRRKVSGIISMNTKLPTETIAYYKDLTAINFVRPSLSSGNIGWIELVGISRDKNVTSTVDANWKMISNVDTVNGLKNPYNIAFNKNHREMEGYYNRIKELFEEFISQNQNVQNITNITNEESALDKIKKLKELLDLGVISQEEFDEKKQKLMDSI